MLSLILAAIFLIPSNQEPAVPGLSPGCLMDQEKDRLKTETSLDRRIRIYDEAMRRCQSSYTSYVSRAEFQFCPDVLRGWQGLLEMSLRDIQSSPGRKERSRALIRYEIRLRRAMSEVQQARIKMPVEQIDLVDAWLAKVEQIRKSLVKILFPGAE